MAGDATMTATGSSIRLNAATDVTLGNVVAMNVSVVADSGSIINAAGSSKNVTATTLRLIADDAIGAATNHLTTAVSTLTALSTGTDSAGIYVTEDDAVAIDTVSVTVTEFSATATTSAVTDNSQSDMRTLANSGNIVLVAGGAVTLNDGTANTGSAGFAGSAVSAHGSSSVLIDVNSGDLTINSDILSTTGHITLKAAGSVVVGSSSATGVDVTTGTAGTISVDAEGGALTMAGDATMTATGSSVRLNAATDVTLGNVVATNVSVVSDTGSIINAVGSTKNVTATTLRLQSDDMIGAATNHLTTAVATLTALSTGTDSAGIYVMESDAVTVDTVSVTVTEFSATATTSAVTDNSQSDMRTLANSGNIVFGSRWSRDAERRQCKHEWRRSCWCSSECQWQR